VRKFQLYFPHGRDAKIAKTPSMVSLESLSALHRFGLSNVSVEGCYAPGEKRITAEISEDAVFTEAEQQGALCAFQEVLGDEAPSELRISGSSRVITRNAA
jgi:hypothetical protein